MEAGALTREGDGVPGLTRGAVVILDAMTHCRRLGGFVRRVWNCLRGRHSPVRFTDGLRDLVLCRHCWLRIRYGPREPE